MDAATLRDSEMSRFRQRWKFYADNGHADLIRRTEGRKALIERVRGDLGRAMLPTARPVFTRETRKDARKIDTPWTELPHEVIDDWRRRHPNATCSYRTECALAWLEQFRPVAS